MNKINRKETFTLFNIQNDLYIFKEYIRRLNKYKNKIKYSKLILKARVLIPELNNFKLSNVKTKQKDKGRKGKIIEYCLFGQKPNCISLPDYGNLGIEIKITNFKKLKNNGYNAKERVTISNIGSTNNYKTFNDIIKNEKLENTRVFNKIKKILLIGINHSNKTFMGMCLIDYNELEDLFKNQIMNDYKDIRNKIINKTITQKGQKFLHIHKHGSKGHETRALGFKQKFITEIFSKKMKYKYFEKYNSYYFNIKKNEAKPNNK